MRSFSSFNISTGLGRKFFQWFLVMALIPLVVVSVISYHNARESLLRNTDASLTAAIELKKSYIEAFFAERMSDLELQAALAENIQFVADLRQARHSAAADGGGDAVSAGRQVQADLKRFVELYGYHDVLLIDPGGTILFTVHGNEGEVGANIFADQSGETLFAGACRRALVSGRVEFADMESHGDNGHELDSFLVRAMRGPGGEMVGLMALEMSLEQVDRLMQDRIGMGATGETFLVGSDQLMRSDSWRDQEKTAMRVKVATDPVRAWLAVEEVAVDGATQHRPPAAGVSNYRNHRGERVLGVINNLETLEPFGVHWALVAEVGEKEALGLVRELRSVVVFIFVVTTIFVALLSALLTRGIVAPIQKLSDWSGRVAMGDLSPLGEEMPRNELGELYGSFSRMVASIREVTDVCAAVAVGDFSKSVAVRGEHDALGQAVKQMGENLRTAVGQADVLAAGDFSVQITPWSEKDKFGAALLRMTSQLRKMDEAAKQSLGEARLLANYLDKLPIPVLCIDPSFKITYINEAGAAFAKLDEASCLGKRCYDLFGNVHCRTRDCRVGRALRN